MRRRILEKGYVKVRPGSEAPQAEPEVRWLTPDTPLYYQVYSNTQWEIK